MTQKRAPRDLDLTNAGRGVWLVKIPKYVAASWEQASPGGEVGRLSIVQQPGAKASIKSFTLTTAKEASDIGSSSKNVMSGIPTEYKFAVSSLGGHTLGIFSQTFSQGKSVRPDDDEDDDLDENEEEPEKLALEGKVIHRAECRPIGDNTYMKLKAQQIVKAVQPVRTAKRLDTLVNTYKPIAKHAHEVAFERKLREEGKKSRDEKGVVLDKVYEAFEKHQYYALKDLVRLTNQPVAYLKEILKDICVYNLKNPHKNMYELRPELRYYKSDSQGEDTKMEAT